MAEDKTKVTDLNIIDTLEDTDLFMVTHEDGLTEALTSETLFKNGSKTISLTRAKYDALPEVQEDTIYVITDEEVTGVTVDQEYDPESENPQSGVALNGALTNLVENGKDESNENDLKYYRKHADGFLEQWGLKKVNVTSDLYVNFLESYKDKNYVIITTASSTTVDIDSRGVVRSARITNQQFRIEYANTEYGMLGVYYAWHSVGYWK